MPDITTETGYAPSDGARLYYEVAGEGRPFVMIHAGVADSRQWNNEFLYFAQHFRVVRYDMRGYGQSEPVAGEYRSLDDLIALLDHLHVDGPAVLMGCSMGGELAIELALAHPERAAALIMVDSAPPGLELDVPDLPQFEQAEKAYRAGDLDRLCEIETQIWFDGIGRTAADVDPAMRQLLYEMNRTALANEAQGLGKRLPNAALPAVERLAELQAPLLAIVGANDIPYMLAAAGWMEEHLPGTRKVVIENAAHLPNMEHPVEFRRAVTAFLQDVGLI
jgi:pimeloyl-ACP methyl ester carboxylesterase